MAAFLARYGLDAKSDDSPALPASNGQANANAGLPAAEYCLAENVVTLFAMQKHRRSIRNTKSRLLPKEATSG